MLLEKICKELGVEIGEVWTGNDGKVYAISKTGEIAKIDDCGTISRCGDWKKVLTGKLRPVWKPKEGELYYVPSIKKLKDHRFHEGAWFNDDIDNWYMANNMIFKTKEEAIDCATNMIDLAKHGI